MTDVLDQGEKDVVEDDDDANTEGDMPNTPSSLPAIGGILLPTDVLTPLSDPGCFSLAGGPHTPIRFDSRVVIKTKRKSFFS